MCVCACGQSCLSVTLWTVACQVPLSMEFSRQEYWSSLQKWKIPFKSTPPQCLLPGCGQDWGLETRPLGSGVGCFGLSCWAIAETELGRQVTRMGCRCKPQRIKRQHSSATQPRRSSYNLGFTLTLLCPCGKLSHWSESGGAVPSKMGFLSRSWLLSLLRYQMLEN